MLARLIVQRGHWILIAAIAILIIDIWALRRARFSTDVLELLPQDSIIINKLIQVNERFVQGDDALAFLQFSPGTSKEAADAAAQELASQLRKVDGVLSVRTGLDIPDFSPELVAMWLNQFYWFLSPPEIEALKRKLEPVEIQRRIHQAGQEILSSPSPVTAQQFQMDPLGLLPLSLGHFKNLAPEGLSLEESPTPFRVVFMECNVPSSNADRCQKLRADLVRLRETLQKQESLPPHTSLQFTGKLMFTAEISAAMKEDIQVTAVSAFFLVEILFLLGYRRFFSILGITPTLILAVLSTFAIGSLFFGGLNVISASFAAILIGLGVDYGVLIYNRFAEEMIQRTALTEAVRRVLRHTGPSVLLGAATTAVAFVATTLTGFPGFRQFGWLIAIGIFFCVLGMYTIFLSLVVLRPERARKIDRVSPLMGRLGRWTADRPKLILTFFTIPSLAALGFIFLFPSKTPLFNTDSRALRLAESESYHTAEKLGELFNRKTPPLAILLEENSSKNLVQSIHSAARKLETLKAEGKITTFETPAPFVPNPDHVESLRRVFRTFDLQHTQRALVDAMEQNGFDSAAFESTHQWLERLQRVAQGRIEPSYDPTQFAQVLPALKPLIRRYFFVSADSNQWSAINYFNPAERSESIEEIQDWERTLNIDRKNSFLTGWSAMLAEIQPKVRDDFRMITLVVLVAVFLMLLISFRSLRMCILSLIPLMVSLLWLIAIMKWQQVSFTLMNIFSVPLLLGIGVDYAIYILMASRERNLDPAAAVGHVGRAILLSALGNFAGFGSLMWAKSSGLNSLGFVCGIGILLCLVNSLLLLPALLKMTQKRAASTEN